MGVESIGVVPMGVISICAVGMGVLNACVVGMGILVASVNVMSVWWVGMDGMSPKRLSASNSIHSSHPRSPQSQNLFADPSKQTSREDSNRHAAEERPDPIKKR